MAILGKVAGTMLKDNLVRNGVDLIIDSNLMYYDVNNRRIGINTIVPGNVLTVNGSVTASNVYINNTTVTALNSDLILSSLTGNINANTLRILNVVNPINLQDAATKNYVDQAILSNIGTENNSISNTNANLSAANAAINTINSNVSAANLAISQLQSNVGAYEEFANIWLANLQTNVITIDSNIAAANLAISTLQSNVVSYNIWANNAISDINSNVSAANSSILTLQSQVYNNSNVDAYLPTYAGNLSAGNINVIPGAVYSNEYYYANGVIFVSSNYGNTEVNAYLNALGITNAGIVSSDTFTGDGSTSTFNLSQQATTSGTIVSINGVMQIPTLGYSISGNVLTLSEAPVSTDVVEARTVISTPIVQISYSNNNVAEYLPTYRSALTANNFNATAVYAGTIGNTGAVHTGSTGTFTGNVSVGNVLVNGNIAVNGPTFMVFLQTQITSTSGFGSNVIYNGVTLNVGNAYNASTGVFQPTYPGYYSFQWTAGCNTYSTSTGICTSSLYKNNSEYARGQRAVCNVFGQVVTGSAMAYLNGSTDYVHVQFLQGSGSTANLEASSTQGYANYFSGSMVRGA